MTTLSFKSLTNNIRKAFSLPDKFLRLLLFSYYRFDKWHVHPLSRRKYALDIIKYLNKKPASERQVIIEIGCGLGDLLRSVRFEKRIGYDLDANALRAAKWLSKVTFNQSIVYNWFKFPESRLDGTANVIILVNWVHHIVPDVLKQKIEEYFNGHLLPAGEIIIDTVQSSGYKFNHSISYLTSDLKCSLVKISDDINEREIFVIRKN
jgi:SAM-dependent methyltransferase